MHNILEKARQRDHHTVEADAQAIYLGKSRSHGQAAFRNFRARPK